MTKAAKESVILGVDIGGSHITAAYIDLGKRQLMPGTQIRKKVDSHGSAEEILEVWKDTLSEVLTLSDYSGHVGIAMPGPFNYKEGISLITGVSKYEAIYGMHIGEIFASHLGIEPSSIIFRNDAEAFLLGEVYCGAAKGFNRAIGITLGTGLGSAIYIDGIAEDAALGTVPFKDGIREDYLSTRWFVKRYRELTGHQLNGGVKELAEMASKEPVALHIFREFGKNFGIFLNEFISSTRPEIVVIGGNILNSYPLFEEDMMNALKEYLPSVQFKKTLLGEDAALIGAACSWQDVKFIPNLNQL